MSLYFISVGNKLFSTRISKKSKNTCLIALIDRNKANNLRNHIVESQKPIVDINYYDHVKVKPLDYNTQSFKKMMNVNNFSLMLAHDFTIDKLTNEYEFHGDALEFEHEIDYQTVKHLDDLYDKDYDTS